MITCNILFSGIGAQEAALKRLGLDFKVIGISEIDKYAIQSYEAINGPTRNYGDITQIERLDYADLWTYSSPCFTADSLVLTEYNGYKQITDIQTGESVLTHDGTFKSVENIINNGVKPTVKIYGMGFDEIHTTENHKFYVREKAKIWNNLRRSYDRVFSNPVWKQAIDLTRNDYLGFPVNKKSVIPEWNGITFVWSDGRSDRHKNQLSKYMDNKNFWWLIGRYIADGWFRHNGGIVIGCGKKKFNEMKEKCDSLDLNYNTSEERTVIRFHYALKELELFVQPFGKYAHGKKIPSFVMNLPIDLLESFLEGYMAGDGCFTNRKFKATSVSRELVYGLAQCVAKVYKRPFSIYKTKRAKTTVIEGRVVNQRDTYELTFNKENHVQDKAFYENGYVWYPFNKIEKAENEVVYDLTVSDNHSFVVNNAIVHNCQDFSTAGKQKGIYNADGSLTRSGLLKHVERLLTDSVLYGTQPKYLLLENVKALVSKKFMPDFQRWLDKLEQLGYNNYWQVLNAKDYGIPQNRERVFVVSIRKDVDTKGYKFPSPVPLEKRLKDMLEPYVDEKYYLSADKVEKLITQIKEKDVSNTIRCGGGSLDGKHTWDIIATPVNLDKDGNARAICNNYSKQGVDNILGLKGFGCTGVIELSKELIFVGGIGEPNRLKDGKHLSRNYKDGYRVYDEKGISTTINANGGGLGGTTGLYLTNEPLCAASRGRNPENPSDKTAGIPTEQTLEINYTGCSNTLTSVQKDNYVVEPKIIQVGNIVSTGNWDNPQRGRIDSPSGCSPALNTCQGGGLEPKILEEGVGLNPLSRKLEFNGFKENCPSLRTTDYKCPHCYSDGYRIRKLTARECWRLMAFTDIEFDCAKLSGVSDSQLYKQAGNSIVVDVLVGIFRELFNDRL